MFRFLVHDLSGLYQTTRGAGAKLFAHPTTELDSSRLLQLHLDAGVPCHFDQLAVGDGGQFVWVHFRSPQLRQEDVNEFDPSVFDLNLRPGSFSDNCLQRPVTPLSSEPMISSVS